MICSYLLILICLHTTGNKKMNKKRPFLQFQLFSVAEIGFHKLLIVEIISHHAHASHIW